MAARHEPVRYVELAVRITEDEAAELDATVPRGFKRAGWGRALILGYMHHGLPAPPAPSASEPKDTP